MAMGVRYQRHLMCRFWFWFWFWFVACHNWRMCGCALVHMDLEMDGIYSTISRKFSCCWKALSIMDMNSSGRGCPHQRICWGMYKVWGANGGCRFWPDVGECKRGGQAMLLVLCSVHSEQNGSFQAPLLGSKSSINVVIFGTRVLEVCSHSSVVIFGIDIMFKVLNYELDDTTVCWWWLLV